MYTQRVTARMWNRWLVVPLNMYWLCHNVRNLICWVWGQDDRKEMEGMWVTAHLLVLAWPGSTRLQFSFSPFPLWVLDLTPSSNVLIVCLSSPAIKSYGISNTDYWLRLSLTYLAITSQAATEKLRSRGPDQYEDQESGEPSHQVAFYELSLNKKILIHHLKR